METRTKIYCTVCGDGVPDSDIRIFYGLETCTGCAREAGAMESEDAAKLESTKTELLERANDAVQCGQVHQVLIREFGRTLGDVLFELVGIGQKYEKELDMEFVSFSSVERCKDGVA